MQHIAPTSSNPFSILSDFFSDACYQALAYWIMSALTNDPFTLARFAGLYKAVQSAVSLPIFISLPFYDPPPYLKITLNTKILTILFLFIPSYTGRRRFLRNGRHSHTIPQRTSCLMDHHARLLPTCLPRYSHHQRD